MRENIAGSGGSENAHSCPICGKSGVWKVGVKECPQCRSNLDILTNVCDLPMTERPPKGESVGSSRLEEWVVKFSLVLVSILAMTLIVSVGAFGYLYHRQMQDHITSLHRANRFFSDLLASDFKRQRVPLTDHTREKMEESAPVNIRRSAPQRVRGEDKIRALEEGETPLEK